MNEEYTKIAHKRAALLQMARLMSDRYVDGDSQARERIISEEVMYDNREVTQDTIIDLIKGMEREAYELGIKLMKMRQEVNDYLSNRRLHVAKQPPTSTPETGKPKKLGRPRSDIPPSGSGNPSQ